MKLTRKKILTAVTPVIAKAKSEEAQAVLRAGGLLLSRRATLLLCAGELLVSHLRNKQKLKEKQHASKRTTDEPGVRLLDDE